MNGIPANPVVLAGPTAVGKTAVAMELARQWDGEIISVDSMAVYRGLNIGTAKPSAEDRARVPHHLVDILELADACDAARFSRLAGEAVADIQRRGKLPILCGGTGLYLKAWLEGLGDSPPADPRIRTELESRPLEELVNELQLADPVMFATIDRRNARRVIRALEVVRATGRTFSSQRGIWGRRPLPARARGMLGLCRERTDLNHRIEQRVEEMFRRGIVEETRELLGRGLEQNRAALQAIGYRQVVEYLRGRLTLEQTIESVKQRTRELARRQMTWFRHQVDLVWIPCEPEAGPGEIAARVASALAEGGRSGEVREAPKGQVQGQS